MRARRITLLLAVAVAATVALAGCGPAGIAKDRYAGTPPGVNASTDSDPIPTVVWWDDEASLAVITYGSSSCPPTVTSIEVAADGTVDIELDPATEGPCTLDIAPTTHVIALPDEATARPLTVRLNYTGEPWQFTITIP